MSYYEDPNDEGRQDDMAFSPTVKIVGLVSVAMLALGIYLIFWG